MGYVTIVQLRQPNKVVMTFYFYSVSTPFLLSTRCSWLTDHDEYLACIHSLQVDLVHNVAAHLMTGSCLDFDA